MKKQLVAELFRLKLCKLPQTISCLYVSDMKSLVCNRSRGVAVLMCLR